MQTNTHVGQRQNKRVRQLELAHRKTQTPIVATQT